MKRTCQILSSSSETQLSKWITNFLNDGYERDGQISVASMKGLKNGQEYYYPLYTQVLIKEEK